jgi:hypothetical protein
MNNFNGSIVLAAGGLGEASGTLICLVMVILSLVGLSKIFDKAEMPGWAAIVPIYNAVVLVQIASKPIWWSVLFFVPIVNIPVAIMLLNGVSQNFGKGIGTTL